jgi:hypothetical protein
MRATASPHSRQAYQGAKEIMSKTATTADTEFEFKFDIPAARKFLSWLDPDTKEFDFRTFWPKQKPDPEDHHSRNHRGSLDDKRFAERLMDRNADGFGVFVTINKTDGRGARAANIVGVRAVWADLDNGMPDDFPIKPSFVVETSPDKYQAYWLVRGKMTPTEFDSVMGCLVQNYGADPGATDIARVLRVPGFHHTKGKPFRCQIAASTDDGRGVIDYTANKLLTSFPPVESKSRNETRGDRALALLDPAPTRDFDPEIVASALAALPEHFGTDYNTDVEEGWRNIMFAIHDGSTGSDEGWGVLDQWSRKFDGYNAKDNRKLWDSAQHDRDERITLGTLFHYAEKHGWVRPRKTFAEVPLPDGPNAQTAIDFGTDVIRSHKKWTDEVVEELLSRMNRDHAVVSIGGSVRYLHRALDAKGRPEQRFLRAEDMQALYAAVLVPQGKVDINAFNLWKRWHDRKQYTGIGMFPPGMKVPHGYLNLWVGFSVEPRKGDWSLFSRHLHEIVCGRNDKLFTWLMDWLGDLFQRPHEKPGSALVLKSAAKGTGKTMLNTFLKRILGVHASSVSKSEHVVGRFNGHLQYTLLLGVEEAFWAGNKAATGALKNLITEPEIKIELKGVDAFDVVNFTRLVFTSNESWAVPVGVDERRFLVLDVQNPDANRPEYFDPIFKQMDKGGLEAMLYELQHREITSNLRRPPETRGLIDQRKHTLEGVERWLWTVAREGEFRSSESGKPIVLAQRDETAVPCAVVIDAAKRACNQYEGRVVDVSLGSLLKKVGVDKDREGRGERRHLYIFPPLYDLREEVKRELRVTL